MSAIFDPENAVYPFPPKPARLNDEQKTFYREKIKALLKARNAVMVAHYYTDPEIQALAEETGGCVSDSLETGALRQPACGRYAAGGRRPVYGGNGQNPQPGKNRPDAHA